jgi:hypothetical protein
MKLIKLNKQLTRTRFCGIIYCRETTPASALRAYLTFLLSFRTEFSHWRRAHTRNFHTRTLARCAAQPMRMIIIRVWRVPPYFSKAKIN